MSYFKAYCNNSQKDLIFDINRQKWIRHKGPLSMEEKMRDVSHGIKNKRLVGH